MPLSGTAPDEYGCVSYNVVDGKQRLVTLFQFLDNEFPVADSAQRTALRGKYFKDLGTEEKKVIWSYQFLIEYLPTTDENVINDIFNRINKNVAKLTPQELRHARFDGEFISSAESLAVWMESSLPGGFPNIASQSRKQMKDVELTATLLLLLDEGVRGYSQADLDKAFSDRDTSWDNKITVQERFKDIVRVIQSLINMPEGAELTKTRLRNQADFYSLFGAVSTIPAGHHLDAEAARRLTKFMRAVEEEQSGSLHKDVRDYYEAARSASNDPSPRNTRIRIISDVLAGRVDWLPKQ